MPQQNPNIILASSSPYRKQLLERLQLPFSCQNPDVDETPLPNESPESLVERLAIKKVQAIAPENRNSLIIGSDQVAVLEGNILTKPGNHQTATAQLSQCSGKIVTFLTSICLFNSHNNHFQTDTVPFNVYFRELSPQDIESYLHKEQAYDCAGSFKAESLGIVLFEKMLGDDPTSLVGLPMIKLTSFLKTEGVKVL